MAVLVVALALLGQMVLRVQSEQEHLVKDMLAVKHGNKVQLLETLEVEVAVRVQLVLLRLME
jgi:hypothetical protein